MIRLQKLIILTVIAIGCLFTEPTFAEQQYPVGTAFVIKHATAIDVQSDNPSLYHINGTAIIFNSPGVANLKIIAKYGTNKAMLFNESVHIIPNRGIENGLQLTFNPAKNGFEAKNIAKNYNDNTEYLPNDLSSTEKTNAVFLGNNVRELVPIDQLANRSLLHWNLTDEQYKMCYEEALKYAKPLIGVKSKEEILRRLASSMGSFYQREVTYSMSAPHFLDAYGFFINKSASCQGESCAVGFVLNILGIEYEHINHNKWKHQWCRVKMDDGTYWVCDADAPFAGRESGVYLQLMK